VPLTVVGESLAKPGLSFVYRGETDSGCAPCKLRSVCHGALKVGREYRIKATRPVKHDVCHVFEGKVQVVEIEEKPLPMRVAIPVTATRGTGFSNHFQDCGASCLLKAQCNPAALPAGVTAKIDKVEGPVPCLVGRKLKFALVTPA
jgi:uncharacterized protein (UPF0179 family)